MTRAGWMTWIWVGLLLTASCTTKEFDRNPKGPYVVPVQHSAPSWVHDKEHRHENYSIESYEHAYASIQTTKSSAEASSIAISKAKSNLIDKIQNSIRESSDSIGLLLGADELPLRCDLDEFNEDDRRAVFLGEFRTDTYRDENGTFHALVLVHRSASTRRWLLEASTALTLWEQNQDSAPRFITAKSPTRALKCHLASASALEDVIRRVARVYGISRSSGIKDLSRWTGDVDLKQKRLRTWDAIDTFIAKISIEEVSGNQQKGSLHGALEESLVARVQWESDQGSLPLRDFPMLILPDSPGSVRIGSTFKTDDEGRVHAILGDLKLTDSITNSISFTLDVSASEGSASQRKHLILPRCRLTYRLETPDLLPVELHLVVNSDAPFSPTESMEAILRESFLEAGFSRVQVRWSIEGPSKENTAEKSTHIPTPTSGVSVLGHIRVLTIPGFENPHFEALSRFQFLSDSGSRSPMIYIDPVMPPLGHSEFIPSEAARSALENLLTRGRVARNLASEFRRWTME